MSIDGPHDLEGLRRAGRAVAAALAETRAAVAPGVSTAALDAIAARVFARHGARSAPMDSYGFPGFICISVNDEAVHGIPGPRLLESGDLVTLDVTASVDGYVADAAVTVEVGDVDASDRRLRLGAEAALRRALAHVRAGMTVAELGGIVEAEVEAHGLTVLRELTGHGVGRAIHEEPTVPNWADPHVADVLTEGLVITIEPIITTDTRWVIDGGDGWTIKTASGAKAAHAEHTLVVTDGKPIVVTGQF
jgi:methionyl aminopeptidase